MAAQKYRQKPLTALAHHMDLNWMSEAYRCVRKDATPGVDGQTVSEYGESLVENLRIDWSLLFQGVLIGASVLAGLRGCKAEK